MNKTLKIAWIKKIKNDYKDLKMIDKFFSNPGLYIVKGKPVTPKNIYLDLK